MKRSYLLALLIAALAAAWVLSGQFQNPGAQAPSREVVEVPSLPEDEARLPAVRVAHLQARPHSRSIVVRGRTEAKRTVQLRAETDASVVEVPVEKGSAIEKGTVIVRLAVDERRARLEEAKALVRQRQIEYDAAQQLKDKGYRSETQFAAAAAQLDAARAMVNQMEVEIAKTTIRAPFAGILDARPVNVGDYVRKGDTVALIVDQDPFLVTAFVTEEQVGRLSVGQQGTARLATGREVSGRVSFIAAQAEPETRTFRVELEVSNPEHLLKDGVTAELSFPTGEVLAHFVSPAVLTLDDDGTVGVRTVNAENLVEFHPVRIIDDRADGVWLSGLPREVDVIVVGQEFVQAGQKVRTQPVDGTSTSRMR